MAGARVKRIERLGRVFPDLGKLFGLEEELDRNWLTLHASREASFEVPLPVAYCEGMDDVLAVSNFEAAWERLEKAALFDDGVSYRTDHWIGPPIRTLVIRADDAGAVREAMAIIESLEEYAVLDEADYSERQETERREVWEGCHRPDLISELQNWWDVPEELFEPDGWEGLGPVDLDTVAFECPAWESWDSESSGSLDLKELAGEVAAKVRVMLAGPDAVKKWSRDCWCCGAPVIGPVWSLCDGCRYHDRSGDYCDAGDSWHCTREFGHECDGTVCPEDQEEAAQADAEEAERLSWYGGMDPERMVPLSGL